MRKRTYTYISMKKRTLHNTIGFLKFRFYKKDSCITITKLLNVIVTCHYYRRPIANFNLKQKEINLLYIEYIFC